MAKRIFIAFAKEDERIRNLLKGQSLNAGTPFEYVDMSVKEPYSAGWKERTRTRIRGSAGVIALISKKRRRRAGRSGSFSARSPRRSLCSAYGSTRATERDPRSWKAGR